MLKTLLFAGQLEPVVFVSLQPLKKLLFFRFQYGFTFDELINEDDMVMENHGVQLLVDSMSYQYLIGAEIDYQEDLKGAQFIIKNPGAASTCGCGSSFSV